MTHGGKIDRVKAGSSQKSLVHEYLAVGKEGQWGGGAREVFRRWQLQDEALGVLRIWGRGGPSLDLYTQ